MYKPTDEYWANWWCFFYVFRLNLNYLWILIEFCLMMNTNWLFIDASCLHSKKHLSRWNARMILNKYIFDLATCCITEHSPNEAPVAFTNAITSFRCSNFGRQCMSCNMFKRLNAHGQCPWNCCWLWYCKEILEYITYVYTETVAVETIVSQNAQGRIMGSVMTTRNCTIVDEELRDLDMTEYSATWSFST